MLILKVMSVKEVPGISEQQSTWLIDPRETWMKYEINNFQANFGWGISCEIALRWMSLDLNDD